MSFKSEFGNAARKARQKKKLKQSDLARLLHTSQTTIWRIEIGEVDVSAFMFLKLCEILELDIERFRKIKTN